MSIVTVDDAETPRFIRNTDVPDASDVTAESTRFTVPCTLDS